MDNPRGLFEEVKSDATICKIVLQKSPHGDVFDDGANVRFVAADSLRGAYYLATSRVVVIGYSLQKITNYSRWIRAGRHLVVHLSHGIPLKRVGRLFPAERYWLRETHKYSATICSAERDKEIVAQAFAPIPSERVWMTGLPRNDIILKPRKALPADYERQLVDLERLLDGRRFVLYAPTWRDRTESLYRFSPDEENELESVLERHHAVLGIRGHSNVRSNAAYSRSHGVRSIISANAFPEANLLLRYADVLISDYSSIYIDFLLLDRPVLHFAYDRDDYSRERGFLYDLDEAFAGPCVTTFRDLLNALDEALGNRMHGVAQRTASRALFHTHHQESPASAVRQRIMDIIDT